jgi:hypothetical protein
VKIYILPVKDEFQPPTIPVIYPSHNIGFKDAEETYLSYLKSHPEIITDNPMEADWYYLPVFWTHWLVSHNFGNKDLYKLQNECHRVLIDDNKTFTIYEYAEQPKVDIGKTTTFLGSRTSPNGLDIPLLCALHNPITSFSKKYLASFVGSITTHPIRQEIKELLEKRDDVLIADSSHGLNYFVSTLLESYIALCPRGYGGASYRFYEAMQLGTVPFLIGDIDHRPFKKYLDWDKISFYTNNITDVESIITSKNKEELLEMGIHAKKVYDEEFANGNWCKYITMELESL